jgi:hypothetical protein
MAKNKSKNTKKKGSKSFQIITIVVIAVFLVLIMADLLDNDEPESKLMIAENPEVFYFEKHGELTFQNSNGEFISTIDIEFAENDYQRSEGLMYRTDMKENQGMLFIFPYERMQSFWMKSTVLSLDMIFINSDLEIVTIHKNTVPYDESSYRSTAPAQYVLETLAGYTDKYNIKVGDRVVFRKTS